MAVTPLRAGGRLGRDQEKKRKCFRLCPDSARVVAASAVGVESQERLYALPQTPKDANLASVGRYFFEVAVLEGGQVAPRVVLAASCMLASKAAGLAVPFLFRRTVTCLENSLCTNAVWLLAAGGALKASSSLLSEVRSVVFLPAAQRISRRVELGTFEHLLRLDANFHLVNNAGQLSRTMERGVRSIIVLVRSGLFAIVPTLVELLAVSGVLWRTFNARIAFEALASFAAYCSWTFALAKLCTDRRQRANALDSSASGRVVDALSNFNLIQIFDKCRYERHRYGERVRSYQQANFLADRASSFLNMGQQVTLNFGLSVILVDVCLTSGGNVGSVIMANSLILQLYQPLNFLGIIYRVRSSPYFRFYLVAHNSLRNTSFLVAQDILSGVQDVSNIFGLLRRHSEVRDGNKSLPENCEQGVEVDLNNVTFRYGENQETVLSNVSLHFAPGETVGICGNSGSGKSTLLRLLTRTYDTTEGSVHIDGENIRDLQLSNLRSAISLVEQQTALFNDSLLQNVLYARPEATREEVLEALYAAELQHLLERLPNGLDSDLGEGGQALSGGECQRVAIARVR
jgi:ATP-binding cassette subfamily B protein